MHLDPTIYVPESRTRTEEENKYLLSCLTLDVIDSITKTNTLPDFGEWQFPNDEVFYVEL